MSKPLFGELFIDHSESDRNAIHLYVSQPTPLEEESLGRVFTIMDFTDPEPYFQDIIDSIDTTFTKGYYHSSDFDVEVAFERALHRVNRSVQDAISQHGEDWTYHCNAIIGVIKGEEIHISYVGKIEAFLIQGNSIIDILQKSDTEEIKPLKLFTNVVSGQCGTDMRVVMASSNLLDFLSLEKIRRTVHGNAPDIGVAEMEQILTENTTLSNITALVIAQDNSASGGANQVSAPGTDAIDAALESDNLGDGEEEILSNDSMDKLIDQERSTEELLTPSIWPSLKKKINDVTSNISTTPTPQQSNYVRSENKVVEILKLIWQFISTILTQIVVGLIYLGKMIGRAIRNSNSINGGINGIKNWFTKLSTPRKIFLAIAIVVLLFFIISLFVNNNSNEQVAEETNYDEILSQVEHLLDEAETKEILNEDEGARTSVTDAATLLETVPRDSEAFQANGTTIEERITELNNTFNKVTAITPELIADFATVEGFTGVDKIERIGDNVFGYSTQNGGIYKANVEADSVSQVISPEAATDSFITLENDSAATTLATNADGNFVQFNPVLEKTSPVNVAIAEEDLEVTDIDLFNDRLYVLDSAAGEVYRHNPSGDSYGSSTNWITSDDVDITGALSFDIDSSIYVLMDNGTVTQLDNGGLTNFSVEEFTPGMGGATKIFKDVPGNPFYVLNPTARTVIVLNEDGSLKNQYTADQFNELKDMVIDESTGTAYVLSGSSIYQFQIEA